MKTTKRFTAFASTLALAMLPLLTTATLSYAAGESSDSTPSTPDGTPVTWSGWITDETCGARNANPEGKACALKCAKNGARLMLYVDGSKKMIGLDDQDEAARHVGFPVTVTGTLEKEVIRVLKIEQKKG